MGGSSRANSDSDLPFLVNMHEAKTHLSRLVEAIETGEHGEIVIARNGRPVARLTTLEPSQRRRRLGVARGRFSAPGSIDAANPPIAALFAADQAGADQVAAD